jgi:hypothetical protein
MIQRREASRRARASPGSPNGPTAYETSASAVAAKKKMEAIATRRRSSCAASFAHTAHAREKNPGRRSLTCSLSSVP